MACSLDDLYKVKKTLPDSDTYFIAVVFNNINLALNYATFLTLQKSFKFALVIPERHLTSSVLFSSVTPFGSLSFPQNSENKYTKHSHIIATWALCTAK